MKIGLFKSGMLYACLAIGLQAEESSSWWSFQPVKPWPVPQVEQTDWCRTAVDNFILARLEANHMGPAPDANRRALARRATFDLTGLPPTPEEIEAFVNDTSESGWDDLIERLLASPHYGERWGRHWLDVVRYADTSGCNGDFPMPEAYRYRNYVIDSFNRDKPYNRFLREQIAGDLLPWSSDEERREQVIATGYLAISRRFSSLGEEFHLTLDDTIDNVGKAILGLTVSCARCHEHKFDPIPQEDYYALYGIFNSSRYAFPGTEIYRHPQHLTPLMPPTEMDKDLRTGIERMKQLDTEIFAVYSKMAEQDTGKEKERLRRQWKKLEAERDNLVKSRWEFEKAYAVSEGEPADEPLHRKGDPKQPGAVVPRGFLHVLGGQMLPPEEKGSGRLELARWLSSQNNPLTARVMVNRIWLHHFGKGLVRTPNEFGTRGAVPTHPELLDYLADRFVREGWSVKSMHRLIMRSRAYRMAVVENTDYALRDPDNTLLWSFNRRRLSAEEIRDAMLAVSGRLDWSVGGKHPFKPVWDWRYTQHKPFVDDFSSTRRSVYLMQQRIRQQPFLGTFDGADSNVSTGLRKVSTTPQQALFMLNNEFAHDQARAFADRLAQESGDDRSRLERAFRLALGRAPTVAEVDEGLAYLAHVGQELAGSENAEWVAWSSYLRVLMSSNEFVFVD